MTQPRTLEYDPGADIAPMGPADVPSTKEDPKGYFDAWVANTEAAGDRWRVRKSNNSWLVEREVWVPAESSDGGSGYASQFGVSGQSGESGGDGEWKWVQDRNASIWYEQADKLDLFDEPKTGGGGRSSGSGSGRAYVEVDPSKKAQSAFSDFLSRAKGVYSLEDQEFDWVQSGNRYNMDMAKNFRDVGGFGFSDLYVGQHPDTKLSRDFRPYVDEGVHDPDWMALASQPSTGWGNGVRGYAQGTLMGDPMAGVPDKLKPLIGVPSIYVGDAKRIPGIPTGQMEGAQQ